MTERMTLAEFRAAGHVVSRSGRAVPGDKPAQDAAPAKPNKYHAKRTTAADGRTYDSAKEARLADELAMRKASGEIAGFIPQVSIPCGEDEKGRSVRYRVDFLVLLKTGHVRWLDCKGMDTPASRVKRSTLRQHGVNVEVV